MRTLVLAKGREKSVLRRHPWIFSGAVEEEPSGAAPGETVAVAASGGGPVLAYASYSPASSIRARILSFDPRVVPDGAFAARLAAESVRRRARYLAEGPDAACRLVNAESDFLPGVVADFYAGWIVCQFTSAGADAMKDAVAAALMEAAGSRAKGVAERLDADARAREGLPVPPGAEGFRVMLGEEPPQEIEIAEGACRYLVDVRAGHKTGFYLDQRGARAAVARYAAGADVLNCFSYTGGFGIAAAKAGAKSVLNIDASAPALALAARNAALNGVDGVVACEQADVFKFLRSCRDSNRTFDMIVLDPPKFADSRARLEKAARGYKDINLLAMKMLRPGGTLATFSCSGAMDADLFGKILAEAATDARRQFRVLELSGQGPDHPVSLSFPEGRYLKGAVLQMHNER